MNNQQRTMTIYLAGPIDDVSIEEACAWRDQVASLAPAGCLLFNPVAAWQGVSPLTAAAVAFGDRCAIVNCDGVLANLAGPGRAFGTIREIEFARNHGKPVAVAAGEKALTSCFAHDVYQEETLEEALMALIQAIREKQDTPPFAGILIQMGEPGGPPFDQGGQDAHDGD
jgi:nucleoside 2-deoxyribosyltransferase